MAGKNVPADLATEDAARPYWWTKLHGKKTPPDTQYHFGYLQDILIITNI